MKPIIEVENLAKVYTLGTRDLAGTFREAVTNVFRLPFRSRQAAWPEQISALRDVSFAAAPGDVIGVIGRNGAGK
jgi:ABC-type polysaccharide/polyol phosphate transport system ATPase subunit